MAFRRQGDRYAATISFVQKLLGLFAQLYNVQKIQLRLFNCFFEKPLTVNAETKGRNVIQVLATLVLKAKDIINGNAFMLLCAQIKFDFRFVSMLHFSG